MELLVLRRGRHAERLQGTGLQRGLPAGLGLEVLQGLQGLQGLWVRDWSRVSTRME